MDKLIIRRQLLKALREVYPAPVETAELVEALPLAQVNGAQTAIHEELLNLEIWGFVSNLREDSARPPWWRITGEGLAQITKEAPRLDVRIWGRLAC